MGSDGAVRPFGCNPQRMGAVSAQRRLFVAGMTPAEAARFVRCVAALNGRLAHEWQLIADNDAPDLVVADLRDFGGRCARIRALDEGRHLAVVADDGENVLGAAHTLPRSASAEAVLDLLNRVADAPRPAPRRFIQTSSDETPVLHVATPRPPPKQNFDFELAPDFLLPRPERQHTRLEPLLQHGPVLIQRAELQPLMIDPGRDAYHTHALLHELEPYFLDPMQGGDWRRATTRQLRRLREEIAPKPLVRLRWLDAFLHSNGWLAREIDPTAHLRLQRWLHLGRGYVKQHRIGLSLMHGGQVQEIARRAEADMGDVFDVVNAYAKLDLLVMTRVYPNAMDEASQSSQGSFAQRFGRQLANALLGRDAWS